MSRDVAIVGTGTLAEVLVGALREGGDEGDWELLGVLGRDPGRAADFAARVGPCPVLRPEDAVRATLLFLAVPDDRIAPCAETLADLDRRLGPAAFGGEAFVLHAAGSRGPEVCRALEGRVAAVLHPPFSLAGLGGGTFGGRTLVAHGDPGARAAAEDFGARCGGRVLWVEDLDPALYHAACALAANGLSALLDLAARWLECASGGSLGLETALGLARSSIRALEGGEAHRVLTGPVRRGEAGTISRHLRALAGRPRVETEFYRALFPLLRDLAVRGGLPPSEAAALDRCFRDPPGEEG